MRRNAEDPALAWKPTILIVDDDLADLELIASILEPLHTMPKCVQSSRTAAELISTEKYDSIFLDWLMPEMNGIELARHIRESKRNSTVPIVMLTVKTEPEAMQHAFQAGVNFFLTKPLTAAKAKRLLNVSRGMILAERRREKRVSVSLDVLCSWNGERVRGKALNLSNGGVFLRPEKAPPQGVAITVALQLPGRAQRIELVGTVARVVERTGVGVKFTKCPPADRKLLAEFIDNMVETLPPERVVSQPISHQILIADDNATERELLEALLVEEGYMLRLAGDGQEALESFTREQPDLVLLDVKMPKLNGFD
ncbi:MAG: response regulator, partial [Acidobacteriota bacterium]